MSKFQDFLYSIEEENPKIKIRSYSGRGMYGKYCLGVVCDNGGQLFSAILNSIKDTDQDTIDEIAEAFSDMKQDNMGLGIIIYFPNIAIENDQI